MIDARAFSTVLISLLLAACGKGGSSESNATAGAAAPAGAAHAFQIGEVEAFALKDGEFVFPNDNQTVATDRSAEDVAALLGTAGVSTSELNLSIQPLLVKSADKVILFDTGTGSGTLLASLQQAGVEPASVTDIFVSHTHGDHIGGLVDSKGRLVFTNAVVRLSAPEWDALAANSGNLPKGFLIAVAPLVKTFEPGEEVIPGLVKAVDIKGHTPGHSGYLITSGEESLLYIGDTAHHHVVSVQQPEWTIRFDGDAPTAQASRKALIEQNAAVAQRIYAVHFPFPGLGTFTAQGDHYVWTPAE